MPDIPASHRHDIAKLVEKQMRNWELSRAQRPEQHRDAGPQVADFVTISRMVGAGGHRIATELAARTQWPLFDREILHVMSGDDTLRNKVYAELDERDRNWIEETFRWVVQGEFRKDDYFHRLTETVLAIARQGHAIFLGRGADLMLPRERGLRVQLNASPEDCATNLALREGLDETKARAEVDRIQHERTEFVRRYFGKRATDALRHDLIINTSQFTPPQSADLIVSAMRVRGLIR